MTTIIHNSGQTLCHDRHGRPLPCRGSGQDGEFRPGRPWPTQRFELSADGAVALDRLTDLHWSADADPAGFPLSRAEAGNLVAEWRAEARHGFDDWRLPNRRELLSLVSFGAATPCLPGGHPFRNAVSNWYWSADEAAIQPGYFWYVQFLGGRMFFGRADEYHLAWPVRGRSATLANPGPGPGAGVPWPEPRFEVLPGDEAVLDRLTNLVWARDADPRGALPWPLALALPHAANERVLAGRVNWRLPTILELESLVDATRHTPALPADHPFVNARDTYWSATNSALDPSWAMCLYLNKGGVGVAHKPGAAFHAWVVSPK
ncbi:DUF1566 domain-containing protein [Desulfovibrio aminophilus]|nr:DUF1566 domain-containing protein [Desulfovibrio aminophilus]MCM0756075.1 DUF1566 domain-containing protein [Desulfovibrio aminophilus]